MISHRGRVDASRQLQRDGREVAVRPPKYGSERVVYLPEQLVTMLSEHVATYRSDGEPGRWLFADLGGRPLHNNAVTYRWRQTRKAAGTPSIRLHDYADLRVMPTSVRMPWWAGVVSAIRSA